MRVIELQRAPGGEAFESGGQRVDGAPGTALVEQPAQFGEPARFADHQAAQLHHPGLDHLGQQRAGQVPQVGLQVGPKYVASTTLTEPLPWENSVLLADPVQQVAGLKREKDLVIMGSGALVQSLSRAGLIDEYLLTIAPLVMGEGHRLFPERGPYAALTLVKATSSNTGVIIATYRPAG